MTFVYTKVPSFNMVFFVPTIWVVLTSKVVMSSIEIKVTSNTECESTLLSSLKCSCSNEKVTCQNIDNVSWASFLVSLPSKVKEVFINQSRFEELNLPENIQPRPLTELEVLSVESCKVPFVSSNAFSIFPRLTELYLANDSIKKIAPESFRHLPYLRILNLRGNVLTEIHPNSFHSNLKLGYVDLSRNYLATLPPTLFQNATFLYLLNMTKNHLHDLPPDSLSHLSNLRIVDFSNNHLEVIHEGIFLGTKKLERVFVQNNPWACDCGFSWMLKSVYATRSIIRKISTQIVCNSPNIFNKKTLNTINVDHLPCEKPKIFTESATFVVKKLGSMVLDCKYFGYPKPSLYWLTPRGILVSERNKKWLSSALPIKNETRQYIEMPNHPETSLTALINGSLLIRELRYYFTGSYSCVAGNPRGLSMAHFNISVESVIVSNIHISMAVGGITALIFMLISLLYLCVRTIIYSHLKQNYYRELANSSEKDKSFSPDYSDSDWLIHERSEKDHISPKDSPAKCTTPVDTDVFDVINIRDTLEGVRQRLRIGMEKSVSSLRCRAQHVSESSRQYMYNIRESSSQTIQKLKSSSSNYSSKVKEGVVMGVEQVKHHVQSMKELCLPGNIDQTISVVSVAQGVDSDEKTEVVRKSSRV